MLRLAYQGHLLTVCISQALWNFQDGYPYIAITTILCVGHAADESWYVYGQIYTESDCVCVFTVCAYKQLTHPLHLFKSCLGV